MATSILWKGWRVSKVMSRFTAHRLTAGTRQLLSAAYTEPRVWEQRQPDPHNLAELAAVMDLTYEKKLPVSSLTISRFVDNISSREEAEQTVYYLYKFRHSPNCWYLRDWTVHSWFRQCLKHGARDKAFYTLKNKIQFGIFPDDFTFNLLLDSFLKDEDYQGACSVVEEIMLQEAFEQPSTQVLSLYALASHLRTEAKLTWQEERNMGAALLIAGLKQNNAVGYSAQLLGCVFLGKVELRRGIHAVCCGAPLMWTSGYINRAMLLMERVCSAPQHVTISKDVLDSLEGLLKDLSVPGINEEDEINTEEVVAEESDQLERAKLPEYISRFKDLRDELQGQDRVDDRTFLDLVSGLAQDELGAAEAADIAHYRERLQEWEKERQDLIQREEEQREKARQQHNARVARRVGHQ